MPSVIYEEETEQTERFDSIVSKAMLYLNEILFVFGLVLLLIILVRLALWLWKCGDSGQGPQTDTESNNDKNEIKRKRKKFSQDKIKKIGKKKNEEKTPPPVPKPDDLNDEPEYRIPDPGVNPAKFVLLDQQQLPRPSLDPRLSLVPVDGEQDEEANVTNVDSQPESGIAEQTVILEMDAPSSSSANANNPTENEEETIIVTLAPESEKETKDNEFIHESINISEVMESPSTQTELNHSIQLTEHTYAEVIRKPNQAKMTMAAIPPTQTEAEVHYETIDKNDKKPEPQVESKPRTILRRTIIRKVRPSSSEYASSGETVNPLGDVLSMRRTPPIAHRCICPYCSAQMMEKPSKTSRASLITSTTNHSVKTNEEMEEERQVLQSLDETIEQMEQITQTLANGEQQDENHFVRNSYNSETLERELEQTMEEFKREAEEISITTVPPKPNRQTTTTIEKTIHNEENFQESEELSQKIVQSTKTELEPSSSYYTTNQNRVIKIDPIYKENHKTNLTSTSPPILQPIKSATAVAKGLVRNRMRTFEPYIQREQNQDRSIITMIHSNWNRHGGARGVVNGIAIRPELPPKPTILTREVRVPVVVSENKVNQNAEIEPEENREEQEVEEQVEIEIEDIEDEQEENDRVEKMPQCAIYAQVIDQIKQRHSNMSVQVG